MGWIIFILGALGWHIGLYGMFKKPVLKGGKHLCHSITLGTWFKKRHRQNLVLASAYPIAGQFVTIWITIILLCILESLRCFNMLQPYSSRLFTCHIWAFRKKLNGAAPK